MRTFLAVDLEEDVMDRINLLIQRYKSIDRNIKWVRPENIHITLFFFGEVDEYVLNRLEVLIKKSLESIYTFRVNVKGISAFPSLKKPRVIWIGVENKSHELITIFNAIQKVIKEENLDVNRETRDYTPHITLGRVKGYPNPKLIGEMKRDGEEIFGSFQVKDIVLYKSTLTRGGPLYEKLSVFTI